MQHLADWLEKLGMSEYAQRFAENDIDASVLPHLTNENLKELGLSLGHRVKLLAAIRELREDLGGKELKGIAGASRAWAVLRHSTVESRFQALRTATMPLVGRDEEIELLMRCWTQAKAGDGSAVMISGEPGIGKSRLAEAFQESIGAEPHTRLRFFCSPNHQDSALYPVITHLERAAGFRREDTLEQRLHKLEAMLAQGTNVLREIVPLLADLLSLPTGDRYPPLKLTPQKRKEKTLNAELAQIEGLAVRQPVLIVFEDVHWSDPTTREVLDLIVDRVPRLRVLVIITFREEFAPPWVGRPHVTMLHLNRLLRHQRAEMVMFVTGRKALPKQVAEQIFDRTDGVPLFIEELTKTVIESGIVTEAGDHYAMAGPVNALAIPTSLHASLLARLDRLGPTREVAQIGAALGRSFSHELVSAVAGIPQDQIDEALVRLVTAELIFRRGTPPDAEYTFKHALVQDTAYSTLLRSRRQQLHARIATTMESRFPEIAAADPAILAQHCTEAGLNAKAVDYRLKAGQQAVARSAMAEAVTQLQKGLALLTTMASGRERQQQELELHVSLIPALIGTKGYSSSDVGETITLAYASAEQLNRPEYFVPLLYGRWVFNLVRAELSFALSQAEQLESVGKESNDPAVVLMAHLENGIVRFFFGELEAARTRFEQSDRLDTYRQFFSNIIPDDPYLVMLAYHGATLCLQGYIDQGRARLNEAILEGRRRSHAHTLCLVLRFATWAAWLFRSPNEEQQYADELLSLSDEHGFPLWAAWAMVHRGSALAALGFNQDCVRLISSGLQIASTIGAVLLKPTGLIVLAEVHGRLEDWANADKLLGEASLIIENTDERTHLSDLHRVRGDLLLCRGDPIKGERSYREAISVALGQNAKVLELRAATNLARLWSDQGKRQEARELLAPVYGWFTEGFDTRDLREAKALLDELNA